MDPKFGYKNSVMDPKFGYKNSVMDPKFGYKNSVMDPKFGYKNSVMDPKFGYKNSVMDPKFGYKNSVMDPKLGYKNSVMPSLFYSPSILKLQTLDPTESQMFIHKFAESKKLDGLESSDDGSSATPRTYLQSILTNKFENWLYPGLADVKVTDCDSCCAVVDNQRHHPNPNEATSPLKSGDGDPDPERGLITIPRKGELVTLFYAPDSGTWPKWKMSVIGKGSGEISSIWDELIQSQVLRIVGNAKGLVHITCPAKPKTSLHIKLPFLNMTLRNFNSYFSMELEILDHKKIRRSFSIRNFQSLVRITASKNHCSMPMRLHRGWNQVLINLPLYVRDAFGTKYEETIRVTINANIYLRRVYFSAKVFDEITLPAEYKIFPNSLIVNDRSSAPLKFRRRQKKELEMILLEDMAVPPGTLILEEANPIPGQNNSVLNRRRLIENGSTLIAVEDEDEWNQLMYTQLLPAQTSASNEAADVHRNKFYDRITSESSRPTGRQGTVPITPTTTITSTLLDDSSKVETASSDSLKVFGASSAHDLEDFEVSNAGLFQRRSTVIYLQSKRNFRGQEASRKDSLSSTHSCPSGNITRDLESKPSFGMISRSSSGTCASFRAAGGKKKNSKDDTTHLN